MKCSDARRTLSALLDREGDPAVRATVARHVEGCAACRGELQALAMVDRALERAIVPRAPAGYHEGLWARLEKRLDGDGATLEIDDVRAMAARAIERQASGQHVVVPELLHAPAVLGQVVLPQAAPEPRRRRWVVGVGAAVAIVAAAAVLVVVRGQKQPELVTAAPPPPPASASVPLEPRPPAPAAMEEKPAAVTAPARPAEVAVAPPPKKPAKEKPAASAPGGTAPAAPPAEPPRDPEKPQKSADELVDEMTATPLTKPEAGQTVGNESLSHAQIKAGMSGVAVQDCRDPAVPRTVVVLRVRITADGKVASSEAMGAHAGTPVGDCVAKKAKAASFDSFDGPPMTIKYSFTLEADE